MANKQPSSEPPGIPHRNSILLLLWMLTGLCGWRVASAGLWHEEPLDPVQGIDPNVAPWWELTLLPEVGPATARAIIDGRGDSTTPAYRAPVDLTRVKGIGPRTVERFGRYLRFESATVDEGTPAASSPVLRP